MKSIHWTINTRNGRAVKLLEIPPKDTAKITAILCPEIGWSLSKYQSLLVFFQEQGIRTLSFDDRIKNNPNNSSSFLSTHEWATQGLDAIILFARQRYVDNELVLFSHGLSAQFIGFSPASFFLQKMVFLNSSLSNRSTRSWFKLLKISLQKYLYALSYLFFHQKNHVRIKKGMLSSLFKWSLKPHGLFDLFPDNNYRKLSTPILALCSSVREKRNAEKLCQYYPSANIAYQKTIPRQEPYALSGIHTSALFPLSLSTLYLIVSFLRE